MKPILIDTNAYSEYHRGRLETLDVVQSAPEIVMSATVLGELIGGFLTGERQADNRRKLQRFLESPRVRVLAVDSDTAEIYAQIYRDLRRAGTPIPQNDMWIAATALQHGLALFTFDQHFHNVRGLIAGQCLADFDDPAAGESGS